MTTDLALDVCGQTVMVQGVREWYAQESSGAYLAVRAVPILCDALTTLHHAARAYQAHDTLATALALESALSEIERKV